MQDMTDEQYFAHPAIDQTQLKQFLADPREWAAMRLNPELKTVSPAMTFGTAFHAHILGTQKVVAPDVSLRSKAGQEWKREQEEQGNLVITSTDMDRLTLMASNLEQEDRLTLRQGVNEKAFLAEDEETGLQVKIKPDCLPTDEGLIIDVKTTGDNSNDGFARSIVNLGYDFQAVFYADVLASLGYRDADRFEFWCFKKTDSCDYRKWTLPLHDDTTQAGLIMAAARERVRDALESVKAYMDMYTVGSLDDLASAIWQDSKPAHAPHTPVFQAWQERTLLEAA